MNHLRARCVLVVEDEWLVRMEIVQAFEDEGSDIVEAGSAEAALALLDNQEHIVDLLVTDVRLGGAMTGWDLAEAARNLKPEIAVIYLSANPPAPERHVHGSRFIDKPALMRDVIGAAGKLLQVSN